MYLLQLYFLTFSNIDDDLMKQRGYTTLNVKKIYTFYSLYLTDHDILAIDESCLHHA